MPRATSIIFSNIYKTTFYVNQNFGKIFRKKERFTNTVPHRITLSIWTEFCFLKIVEKSWLFFWGGGGDTFLYTVWMSLLKVTFKKKGIRNNKIFRYSAGMELTMPSLEERLKVSASILYKCFDLKILLKGCSMRFSSWLLRIWSPVVCAQKDRFSIAHRVKNLSWHPHRSLHWALLATRGFCKPESP